MENEKLHKRYEELKKKHPDAVLLFRSGNFYVSYNEDAVVCSEVLGITLTRTERLKDKNGKKIDAAGFPYHNLDTYLPKLIRAGKRVAICDLLEGTDSGYGQLLLKADGTKQSVLPRDGKKYSLKELQDFVGGYIELVHSAKHPGKYFVVNEEGRINGLPYNKEASEMCGYDLVGDVLVCDKSLIK